MHTLKTQDYIIRDTSSRDEGTLMRVNDIVHNMLQSVCNSVHHDLVFDITEAEGAEILHLCGFFRLGDQSNNRVIPLSKRISII